MILTEAEAKTKRCQEGFGPLFMTREGGDVHIPRPQLAVMGLTAGANAMSVAEPGHGHNMPTIASPGYCIGSKCMAWRWRLSEDDAWTGEPRGYCGKAGVP